MVKANDSVTQGKEELRHKLYTLFGPENKALAEEFSQELLPLYEEYSHLQGKNVIVLFSGGVDTSFIAHFLAHVIEANVTTFSADVGSVTAPANMEEIRARSEEILGRNHHAAVNCKERLADLGLSAIMAEAQLGNGHGHHPASSLSRVAICEAAVAYTKEKGIRAIFHGSNGSQNNPYRFKSALQYFCRKLDYPELEECTPNMGVLPPENLREIEQRYLQGAGITIKSESFEQNVSHDRNLLGDEWEEARIAHPANRFDVREEAIQSIPKRDAPVSIGIRFEKGMPVALRLPGNENFVAYPPVAMLEKLNVIGLPYHIGLHDYPEGRPIGVRAREIHISPAMDILITARNWLKAYQLDDYTNLKLNTLSQYWSHWVMEKNLWTHPDREAMDNVFKMMGKPVNGDVTLTLEPNKITNITSPDAAVHMEGTRKPATSEDIEHYLDSFSMDSEKAPSNNKIVALFGRKTSSAHRQRLDMDKLEALVSRLERKGTRSI